MIAKFYIPCYVYDYDLLVSWLERNIGESIQKGGGHKAHGNDWKLTNHVWDEETGKQADYSTPKLYTSKDMRWVLEFDESYLVKFLNDSYSLMRKGDKYDSK